MTPNDQCANDAREDDQMKSESTETWRQELRRLGWVVKHLRRLSPASIRYLRDLLNDPAHFDA